MLTTRISRMLGAVLLAGLLPLACKAPAPPLVCPDGAVIQHVQYAESDGAGHGERCVLPDGTRHGPSRDWYADGTLRSLTHWVHGDRHGTSTLWFPSGAKQAELQHDHWTPVGRWTNWDEQGHVVDQRDFGGDVEVAASPGS